ncbi:Hypothetical protein BPA_0128600 [Borrelia parkeri SLO]|uniref:Lipoprotein n=1 Tax=Borrelia parkeri SLO TaxID=1313294 RepID=A0ABN4C4S0_BORPR|nr:Hypothetical protein BPA_0128600 [Borrelia parkeri SLO]UPA10888.1 hypothetical protein bpSLO_000766 [Borrelia parkeri]
MVLSLKLLQLDLSLKNLFLSLLVLSCSFPRRNFSILEFGITSFPKNFTSLDTLVDVAYNMFLSGFDLVIIKNLGNKEELDLVNNRVSFGSFKNTYFIRQNNRSSISILAKEKIKIQILDFIEGLYEFRLGVVIDFMFKDHHYGIVVFNFDEEIANNLDIFILNDQITYLNYRYKNLLFILGKHELGMLDIIIRNGYFSLIYDSINPLHIINTIDDRVYSNFSAQISLHSLIYVILSYLYDDFYINSFPKSILIK